MMNVSEGSCCLAAVMPVFVEFAVVQPSNT